MLQELAERVASGDSVEAALSGISVKLGGGKTTVSETTASDLNCISASHITGWFSAAAAA